MEYDFENERDKLISMNYISILQKLIDHQQLIDLVYWLEQTHIRFYSIEKREELNENTSQWHEIFKKVDFLLFFKLFFFSVFEF